MGKFDIEAQQLVDSVDIKPSKIRPTESTNSNCCKMKGIHVMT